PRDHPALQRAAGDICLHFFDSEGTPMVYPGSDRLVRPPLDLLRDIPDSIALPTGRKKAPSIRAGAKTGLMTTLITAAPAAEAVLPDADTDADADGDDDADDADAAASGAPSQRPPSI